jgi:hypothetical protein
VGIIKGVLKEELANSLGMAERYRQEIEKLKGALVKKKIGKRQYCYLAKREGKKVSFFYLGPLSEELKRSDAQRKRSLAQYKKMLVKARHQVVFLRRALRGKEPV